MKQITGINHVGLRVKDLEVSRQFYEELGFKFIVGPVGPEPVAVMEHPSGVNINFVLNGAADGDKNVLMDVSEKHTGYTHVALEVTDLDEVMKELERLKIELSGGPITTPEGATFIFIRDPDKNVIEFHKPG